MGALELLCSPQDDAHLKERPRLRCANQLRRTNVLVIIRTNQIKVTPLNEVGADSAFAVAIDNIAEVLR